ncbi:7712_t:CDS:1, partial [Diversispora eburnea]
RDIAFNLQKIESELVNSLVYEKVFIDTVNDSQLYMRPFTYHMELFQRYIRILGKIKDLIPQQSIPIDKVALILSTSISSSGYQYLTFDNASKLLSSLEILLCFVKKILVGDGEILINEYVNQWMKLSNLLDNESFIGILNTSLKLKHLVALYELVEEQVANG